MKILIVDDEPLVRIGMRSIIPWNEHGFTICGEAGNGRQALDLIRSVKPDLVLTDIVMPEMDGIELIRTVNEQKIPVKFIILSCMSDIGYLQKAMSLGITKYVLKSVVKADEMLEIVEESAQEIRKARMFDGQMGREYAEAVRDLYLNEYLNLALKGYAEDGAELASRLADCGIRAGQRAYLIAVRLYGNLSGAKSKLIYRAAGQIQSIIGDTVGGLAFVDYEDIVCAFVPAGRAGEPCVLENICYRITETLRHCFNFGAEYGFTLLNGDLTGIHGAYLEAKRKISRAFFSDRPDFSGGGDGGLETERLKAPEFTDFGETAHLVEMIENVKRFVLDNAAVSEQEARSMYVAALRYALSSEEADEREICRDVCATECVEEGVFAAKSLCEIHMLSMRILYRCVTSPGGECLGHCSDELVKKIADYIRRNYKKRILVGDIAEEMHFSSDYICKYFKKKTGINLSDYMLRYKIHQGKRLLLEGKNVEEAAASLSFSSSGHFIRTFKKYEKTTPRGYLKTIR